MYLKAFRWYYASKSGRQIAKFFFDLVSRPCREHQNIRTAVRSVENQKDKPQQDLVVQTTLAHLEIGLSTSTLASSSISPQDLACVAHYMMARFILLICMRSDIQCGQKAHCKKRS